jgi:cell division protein FtsL
VTPPPGAAATMPAPAVRPRRVGGLPSPGRPARPLRPPARPRRISGPTRPSARTPARTGQHLPYHLLDRLIRGRAWIAVVAFALIGIVAAQLWVVKLNVGIGRAIEHAATLQRENSALAIEDSALSSGERIEQLASAQGMVPAPPGALHFDTVRGPLDVRLAAAALARPVQPQVAFSTSTTSGTETSASATTGGETASAGATVAQSASTETPPATTNSASAPPPAATATAPSTTAASTPEPSATGGASEAPASAPAGAAGDRSEIGQQTAPGG